MNWKCALGLHRWPKWEQPEDGTRTRKFDGRTRPIQIQRRDCERCGLVDIRVVEKR